MRYILVALCFVLAIYAPTARLENKLKMRIAVAPLDWGNSYWIEDWQMPLGFRDAIYQRLANKLLNTGKFVLASAQSLVKVKCGVTAFELHRGDVGIGVRLPGIGNIGGRATEAKVSLNIRILDTETREVLADEDVSSSARSASFQISGGVGAVFTDFADFDRSPLGEATTKALDNAVERIAEKLKNRAWMAGVADWDAETKEITINAGANLGVQIGDTFEVRRVTRIIRDPATGKVLGKQTAKAGLIQVKQVEQKFSIAEAVDGADFQVGDIVKEIKVQ